MQLKIINDCNMTIGNQSWNMDKFDDRKVLMPVHLKTKTGNIIVVYRTASEEWG